MALSTIRPKLKLPATWATVPDLTASDGSFSKEKPPVEGEPPRRIRRREREYKRLHGQPSAATPPDDPDPGPPPPAASQPVQPDPEPDQGPTPVIDPPPDAFLETAQVIDTPAPEPPSELPLAVPGSAAPAEPNLTPELTFGQAIRAVYALGDRRTCDRVTNILDRCPLEECNGDELTEVAQPWMAAPNGMRNTSSQSATPSPGTPTALYCSARTTRCWSGKALRTGCKSIDGTRCVT